MCRCGRRSCGRTGCRARVWGLTCFTGKQAVWRRLVERYVVGEDAAVAELRARLLAEG